MGFKDIQRKLKAWSLENEVTEIANRTHEDLENLQREQFRQGKGKDGGIIGQYRSIPYARYKHELNPKAGFRNVDGILTGALSRGIKYSVVSGSIYARSDDRKYDAFSSKYPNAFGLNRDSVTIYRGDTLKPEVSKSFRNKVLR